MNAIEVHNSLDQQLLRADESIGTTRHTLTIGDGKLELDSRNLETNPKLDLTGLAYVKFGCDSGTACIWTLHEVPCSWK